MQDNLFGIEEVVVTQEEIKEPAAIVIPKPSKQKHYETELVDQQDANKSHPRNATSLIGKSHIKNIQTIIDKFNSKKLAHAIIFSGEGGIGKATAAYLTAKIMISYGQEDYENFINNLKNSDSKIQASDVVDAVVNNQVINLISLNIHCLELLEKKHEIVVEQIEEMLKFVRNSSGGNGIKIVIIDKIEYLNMNATNALLKILEEPPQNSYFFLISDSHASLLETISSRCISLNFSNTTLKETQEILQQNYSHEQINALDFLLRKGLGAGIISKAIDCDAAVIGDHLTALILNVMLNERREVYNNIAVIKHKLQQITKEIGTNLAIENFILIMTSLLADILDETSDIAHQAKLQGAEINKAFLLKLNSLIGEFKRDTILLHNNIPSAIDRLLYQFL